MRIEQVAATGFGPLVGQVLDLAPAMTVVVGGNETAKSSWHAATYAAVCGIRRGRGQAHERDRNFRARHQPWDGGPWRVGARIVLDDGRAVEITQELDERVDCRAIDLGLARDVSGEIMNDGTVDASMWLGLGRRAFEATACIRQGDLVAVRDAGDALRELIDRAAASGPADESTARALARLADFQREHVGVDRAGAVRPLRRAIEDLDRARYELAEAVGAREGFDARGREVERLQHEADGAMRAAAVAGAARLRRDADALGLDRDRVDALVAELGPRRPGAIPEEQDAFAEVTAAVGRWQDRPEVPPAGEDPAVVSAELAALPDPPAHDTAVAAAVAVARGSHSAALDALHAHDALVDAASVEAPTEPTAATLRDLATRLDLVGSDRADGADQADQAAPESAAGAARPPTAVRAWALMACGALVAVAGLVGGLAWSQPWVVVVAGGVGIAALVAGIVDRSHRRRADAGPPARHGEAWHDQRAELAARATSYGLAADVGVIRGAADRAAARQDAFDRHERWRARRVELQARVATAEAAARGALRTRGIDADDPDLDAAYAQYERRCTAASDTARRAGLRPILQARAERAEQVAARRAQALADVARAREHLRRAMVVAGIVDPDSADQGLTSSDGAGPDGTEPDDEARIRALTDWLAEHDARSQQREEIEQRWRELDRLAGHDGPDGLRERVASAVGTAQGAAARAGASETELDTLAGIDDAGLAALAHGAESAKQAALAAAARLAEAADGLPDVSRLDERVAAATVEVDRVRRLNEVLERTIAAMGTAQERVHRDLAPRLQATLVRWLPILTNGRYVDALVDPRDLTVRVRGAGRPWRDASVLSYGTAEQVYLLLRLALVEHLTAGHDTCPLLLDDVTVHADSRRTREVLDLLLAVSTERQVVLFTQEDAVAQWARDRLGDRPGAIVELTQTALA